MTMTDFFEVDEKQKTVKILNLDDFSVEDLQNYISELQTEILRVQDEIKKKENLNLLNICQTKVRMYIFADAKKH